MKNIGKLISILILAGNLFVTVQAEGSQYNVVQTAHIKEVNTRTRTILLGGYHYYLAIGIKVHDPDDKKLAGIYNLKAGQIVKFKARKNKLTKKVEIREIWIERI